MHLSTHPRTSPPAYALAHASAAGALQVVVSFVASRMEALGADGLVGRIADMGFPLEQARLAAGICAAMPGDDEERLMRAITLLTEDQETSSMVTQQVSLGLHRRPQRMFLVHFS